MNRIGWLIVCFASVAEADTDTDTDTTAIGFLNQHDARVREVVLANPDDTLSTAERGRVRELIDEAFDFHELARLSLGDHWPERTEEERAEYVGVFSRIIESRNLDLFVRYHREGEITYTGETVDESGRAVVLATVPLKKETKEITYYLHRPGRTDAWRIYDLAIDGAGTADGNRRTYSRYIARNSYDELLERLRKQLATLGGES